MPGNPDQAEQTFKAKPIPDLETELEGLDTLESEKIEEALKILAGDGVAELDRRDPVLKEAHEWLDHDFFSTGAGKEDATELRAAVDAIEHGNQHPEKPVDIIKARLRLQRVIDAQLQLQEKYPNF